MNNIYAKAYTELYEILKKIPEEEFNKVPKEILKMLEEKRDKDYKFQLKENIEFENQELLRETKVLLAILFRDYWATEKEKEKIIKKWRYDIQNIEQEKYNTDNIFKNKKSNQQDGKNNALGKTAMIEYKEKNFIYKIFERIRNLFKGF